MTNQRLIPIYGFQQEDASLQLLSDQFSSMNFDGSITRVYAKKAVSSLQPGDAIHFSSSQDDEVIPVLVSSVELNDSDDPAYETDPVYFIYYIDQNGEDQNYTLGSTTTDGGYVGDEEVYTSYEDPTTIDVGTSGWTITKYGNAVFSNVFTRGTIEATAGKIDGILTIGSDENNAIQLGKGISIPGDVNVYNGLFINDTNYFVTKELASSTYTISSATTATESVDSGLSLVTFTINSHGLFTNTTGSKIVNLFGFTGDLASLDNSWSLNTSDTNTITIIVPRITAGTYSGLTAQLEQDGVAIRKSISSIVISNVANVTNTNITFTTSTNHNFVENNSVNISGLPTALENVNGNFTVFSVTPNTFTVKAITVTGTSPYTGLSGSVYKLYNTEQSIFKVGSESNFMKYDSADDELLITGQITATTMSVGGTNGITYDGSTVTIGSAVTINADVTVQGLQITSETGGNLLKIDNNVSGTNDGIYINANNYWYTDGTFSVGNSTNSVVWNNTKLTVTGRIEATEGTIGGFTIGTDKISSTNPSTTSYVGISPSFASGGTNYSFWSGDTDPALAEFSVTNTGVIKSTSGLIGGWSLSATELYSGTGLSRVSLNSSTGVIAVGTGNFGAIDTGFYADKDGKFSLSNQLIFTPVLTAGRANVSTTGTFVTSAPTTITVGIATGIGRGMTVIGTGVDTGTTVTNVSGTTITVSKNVLSNQTGVSLSFILDDMSELSVTGRIKGVVESITPITSPRLFTTFRSIAVSGTAGSQVATFTTDGHAFAAGEKISIDGLLTKNGLNNINNTAANPQYVIAATPAPDSVTFTVSLAAVSGVTSTTTSSTITMTNYTSTGIATVTGNATSHGLVAGNKITISGATSTAANLNGTWTILSAPTTGSFTFATTSIVPSGTYTSTIGATTFVAIANLKELTMGLHPAEGVSGIDTWYHSAGTGLRLDKFNWWLTNNQFRVGTLGSYFKWDGSKFTIQGGNNQKLLLSVGSLSSDNSFSIVNDGFSPTFGNANTPFYVDGTGQFSLGSGLTWNGSTLSINGGGTFTGALTGGTITIGSGENVFKADGTNGISLGSATYANAPFSVTLGGLLTSNSGKIGGWNIAPSLLSNGTVGLFAPISALTTGTGTISSKTNAVTAVSSPQTIVAMTNYIGNGTTIVTGTSTANHGLVAGDTITISGATGTEQAKLNGTRIIISAPTLTTFTFAASSAVAIGTLTTTLGTMTTVKTAIYTATGHTFISGDTVVISGSNIQGYNGTFAITAVATNTFTVANKTNAVATFTSGLAVSNNYAILTTTGFVPAINMSITGTNIAPGAYITAVSGSGPYTLTLSTLNIGMLSGTGTASSYAMYAGSATRQLAPFKVDYAGNLFATSANITGIVNATVGTIGAGLDKWYIGDSLYDGYGSIQSYPLSQEKPYIPNGESTEFISGIRASSSGSVNVYGANGTLTEITSNANIYKDFTASGITFYQDPLAVLTDGEVFYEPGGIFLGNPTGEGRYSLQIIGPASSTETAVPEFSGAEFTDFADYLRGYAYFDGTGNVGFGGDIRGSYVDDSTGITYNAFGGNFNAKFPLVQFLHPYNGNFFIDFMNTSDNQSGFGTTTNIFWATRTQVRVNAPLLYATGAIYAGGNLDAVGSLTSSNAFNSPHAILYNGNSGYSSGHLSIRAARGNSSVFDYILMYELFGTASVDVQARISGTGRFATDASSSTYNGADYAEFFEWEDGNINDEDRRGMVVALNNDLKIEVYSPEIHDENNIIGIVSSNPSIIGNSPLKWKGKYLKDEWGSDIIENCSIISWMEYDEIKKEDIEIWYYQDMVPSDIIIPEDAVVKEFAEDGITRITRSKINPEYDSSLEYLPREERKEWASVGLVGVIKTRKDQHLKSSWIRTKEISENLVEVFIK